MRTLLAILSISGLLILSGCGSDSNKQPSGKSDSNYTLRIRLDEGTGGPLKVSRVVCTATVKTGCAPGMFAKLTKLVDRSPMQACTQVYGGPEVAEITGTVGGKQYKQLVGRTNGCGIADWTSTVRPLIDLGKKK